MIDSNPGISIIICSYNGAARISKCLQNIIDSTFNKNFEIIVVDNVSTDRTREAAEFFLEPFAVNKKIVTEKSPGLSYARWRGINESQFDYILFCDDDNWIFPDFLEIGFQILEDQPSIGILGSLGLPFFENSKPDWFEDFSNSYAVGNLGKKNGKQPRGSYHYGACCFFRRAALMNLKSFGFVGALSDRKGKSLSSGGDVELCYAIQFIGFDLWFDDRLNFHHLITSERLKWDYYLKLKRGIASSFPFLLSYEALFLGIKDEEEFNNYLRNNIILAFKGVLLTSLRSLFKPKQKLNQVQLIETKTKVFFFFRNKERAKQAFKVLKNLFFENKKI